LISHLAVGEDKPLWINNPSSGCMKLSELCTVGMGTSREEAKRNAKVEMVKIFSTNISSKFASSLGSSSEDMQEDIREETQGVLEGVDAQKTYEQADGFYVLAVLNKRIAAEGLKIKINDLDSEIKSIFEAKDNTAKASLKKLYAKRQGLNQTYLFLTGSELPSAISNEQIFATNKEALKGVIVHIYFDEKEPKPFEAATIKSFSDMGYKVTTGPKPDPQSTHFVTGKVIAEKQFLNVKGFKKYKVVLKVAVSNSKKIESGHLNLESTTTGRNYNQAFENAVKEISNELKDKINELSIE
jgi:hypothetical protein